MMKAKEAIARYKTSKPTFTYHDYLNMPDDGKRYEIIHGELTMPPAPNTVHQRIALKLEYELLKFNEKKNLGEMFHVPDDIVLSDMNVAQPDILFIKNENLDIITDKNIAGAPDLVIEVLSPSSVDYDRIHKKEMYGMFGVKEFWVVDPIEEVIEVYFNKNFELELVQQVDREGTVASFVLPGFQIDLQNVFK